MAKADNLTDFLTNTADAIRTAEDSTDAINPQDFEAKITALKLSVQTADANATAADILSGKTAWVKGTKISGSIGTKAATTIIPGTSDQTIASGVYLAGAQTIKGDSNLTTDNIKSGTSIFGVTGSYVGSLPNLQSKSVTYTANGTATITPDDGYDGLSSVDVTVDVASGGGGGAGFKVTFPATATNWDYANYADLLLSDGTTKSFSSYSEVSGQTIENVVGIYCVGIYSFYVLKMTLSEGSLAQCTIGTVQSSTYRITTPNNATMAFYGAGQNTFWWPIADTVISAIEMYNTD